MRIWSFLRDMFVLDWLFGERSENNRHTEHSSNLSHQDSCCDDYDDDCLNDSYDDCLHDSYDDYAHDFDDFGDDY